MPELPGKAEPTALWFPITAAGSLTASWHRYRHFPLSRQRQRHGSTLRRRCPARVGRFESIGAGRRFRLYRPAISLCGGSRGQAGVARAIDLLHKEIERNLAMLGCIDCASLKSSIVKQGTVVPAVEQHDPASANSPIWHLHLKGIVARPMPSLARKRRASYKAR